MITEKQRKSAVKKYNDIMEILGYEHNTIGTSLSEDTEEWNLRDMVAECDYVLSTYYEDGHCNCSMRYGNETCHNEWVYETGMLKRFIKHWSPYINDMECTGGHCSQYD